MINEPGLWELAPEEYHADPCPEPSLSNSLIKPLLLAPAKAKWAHPRLNPLWKPKESTRLDLGSVAHKLLLGRGRGVKVLDFPDWRTNASRQARDEARALGLLPILGHDFDTATAMERAARMQLNDAGLQHAFNPEHHGQSELSLIWFDAAGCWGRNMIDWITIDGWSWEIWDYKTTDRSARPEDAGLGAHVVDMGYDTQVAIQDRGMAALHPDMAGRVAHRLMFQETEPPYLISIVELDASTREIGRKKVDWAFTLFSSCLKSGDWFGYNRRIVTLRHADYLANRWLEREISESEYSTSPTISGESTGAVASVWIDPAAPANPKPKGRFIAAPGKRGIGRPRGSKNKSRIERVRDMVAKQAKEKNTEDDDVERE